VGARSDGRPDDLGRRGEDAALRRYEQAGYRLVARNWRCRLGEIDLVLARGTTLVVCEVKARRGSGLGGPFEAVGVRKREKLRRLAQAFLLSEARSAAPSAAIDLRFDVASVTVGMGGHVSVHVFEDAF
jgi:putative endonuclease